MTAFSLVPSSGQMITTSDGSTAIVTGDVDPSTVPTYRLLVDHYIASQVLYASTIVSEDDFLPFNWIPTPSVDPLNTPAVNSFYAQGPKFPDLIRTEFAPLSSTVNPPITFWKQKSPGVYVLTGLGSNQTTFPPKGA